MSVGYTPTPDFYNDYIAHYGVQGMKWGVRRYQNSDGSLTNIGKKMSRRDKRYMERNLKRELKSKDPEGYKTYKKAKIKSNMHRTYKGSETLLSSNRSKKGQAEINKLVADYTNKTLSDLQKKKRKG